MKVTKQLAWKTALVLALASISSCSSDEEQVEDPVQSESQGEGDDEFTEMTNEPIDDGVEDGMLADEATYSEVYGDESDDMNDIIGTEAPDEDFTDAEFETTVDEPFVDNAQSLTYEPVAPATPAKAQWDQTPVSSSQSYSSYKAPKANGKYENAYVVQFGDTLSKIAQRIYGNAGHWHKLASINNISNPNKIFPGDTLYYESNADTVAFAAAFKNINKQSYVVKSGDTLTSIAHGVFGTPSTWKVLWGYNLNKIDNPHKIFVGQKLSYVRKQDMQTFLAQVDADAGGSPAQLVNSPVGKPKAQTVSQPVVQKAAPVEEIYEEIVVEEEMPGTEQVVEEAEYSEIIEDIVIDEESVIDDEAVFEDFEDAIEE